MHNYRLIRLKDHKIVSVEEVGCSDDDAAIRHAQAVREGGHVEVWEGARRVCQLMAEPLGYSA